MNPMVIEYGCHVDKGRNEGFLCHRCSWSGRSISTRLMSLMELQKHAATEHHILPQFMDEFVSKAPRETRGELEGHFFDESSTGNQVTEDMLRRVTQPHNTKQRGKIQDLFPDAIMPSQRDQQLVASSCGPGYTPAIKNPLQSVGQQPTVQDSLVDYSRQLGYFTSKLAIPGSIGNTALTSSSANTQIQRPQISRVRLANSATGNLETKLEERMGVTGGSARMRLSGRGSIYPSAMSRNLQDEEMGNHDAVWKSIPRTPSPIPNLEFSRAASLVSQKFTFECNNQDLTSKVGSQGHEHRRTPSFTLPPQFCHILQDYATANLGLTAQPNQSQSKQVDQMVSNPHVTDMNYPQNPDQTSSSLPTPTHFAKDGPNNVLGSPFGSTRDLSRAQSDRHNKKKRKLSDEPFERPTSRRQIERPVLRSDHPGELDTAFCAADEVPHRTDIQYRQWLTDYAPDVPHHDLTYEGFKAQFDCSKNKSTYMHLVSEQFLKERTTKLKEYERITMDPYMLVGNLPGIEQINYVNAHRSELVSLMAQRAFQENAAEEKLDDEQDLENARIDLTREMKGILRGAGPNQFAAPNGDPLDSKTIPGRRQVLLPNGELFDHTAEYAMPDSWEDAAKLLIGEETLEQQDGLLNGNSMLGNGIPYDDQFFDFEAASAPGDLPPSFEGEEEEGFMFTGLGSS